MTAITPDDLHTWTPSTVRFRVSNGMIETFSALTADRSLLHVSEAFARRSAYRRPVAHGMLPVSFIALLDLPQVEGYRCIPAAISGHFLAPVYAGDWLLLSAQPSQAQSRQDAAQFDYFIRNEGSGEIVTRGTVTVVYGRKKHAKRIITGDGSAAMLPNPPEMRHARLEEIKNGQTDEFEFRVVDSTLRDFANLLSEGLDQKQSRNIEDLQDRFCLPNLLSILLISTSVGVNLPGASATFLEFSAEGDGECETDKLYRLRAQVTHVSRSTRIVKKTITISGTDGDDHPRFRGKVAALVNKPYQIMPTIQNLKATALDFGLKDKVVLITGASRGIGETTAKLFGLLGSKVIVNYHAGSDDAARVVNEIRSEGGEAIPGPADVTNPEAVNSLVRLGLEKYGAIHVLVNNAARDYRPIPFLKLTWDDIQKDLDVISKGAFLCSQQVIPLMIAQGGGKIINISSVAVENPPRDQTKYVMAKSALVGLTRSLSTEFASKNIQVNLVVPNFVETDLVAHIPEGFRSKIAQEIPMQRLGSPIEVAQAVVFLASSFASFTTGQKIMVTGGGAPYL